MKLEASADSEGTSFFNLVPFCGALDDWIVWIEWISIGLNLSWIRMNCK